MLITLLSLSLSHSRSRELNEPRAIHSALIVSLGLSPSFRASPGFRRFVSPFAAASITDTPRTSKAPAHIYSRERQRTGFAEFVAAAEKEREKGDVTLER